MKKTQLDGFDKNDQLYCMTTKEDLAGVDLYPTQFDVENPGALMQTMERRNDWDVAVQEVAQFLAAQALDEPFVR